ncbi:hypothetical protein F4604DRAFT_1673358 [Suillus subluteus]|nr:hypothetical protein F4604DRAFT_1673358 [Suillus subluteus]
MVAASSSTVLPTVSLVVLDQPEELPDDASPLSPERTLFLLSFDDKQSIIAEWQQQMSPVPLRRRRRPCACCARVISGSSDQYSVVIQTLFQYLAVPRKVFEPGDRIHQDILATARNGGSPILEENSMLATAVRRAKDAGVPKENIENALLKALLQACKSKPDNGQAVSYEAMMHGTVGIIMLQSNSYSVNEEIALDPSDIGDLFNAAVSTQCTFDFDEWEDDSSSSRGIELVCSPDKLFRLEDGLRQYIQQNANAEILVREVRWAPLEEQESINDEKDGVSNLVQAVEEDEDVTHVSTSLEYSSLLGNALYVL